MNYSTVTVSSKECDYVGTVDSFTHLQDIGLFVKKTGAGVELIVAGNSSSTLITISR